MEPPRFFPKLDRSCAQATANLASSPSIERTTCWPPVLNPYHRPIGFPTRSLRLEEDE